MSFDAVLNAIVAGVKPLCRNVEAIPGPLDDETLNRIISTAPAARVAPIGVVAAEAVGNGQTDFTFQFAMYLVTKPTHSLDVGDALALVGGILGALPRTTWGRCDVHPVEDDTIRAETLSTADLLSKGVALWAVTWRQTVRMGADMWAEPAMAFPPVADARYDEGRFVETAVDLRHDR